MPVAVRARCSAFPPRCQASEKQDQWLTAWSIKGHACKPCVPNTGSKARAGRSQSNHRGGPGILPLRAQELRHEVFFVEY